MAGPQTPAPRNIESIAFGDGVIQVGYVEGYDQTDDAYIVRNLTFKTEDFAEYVAEILSDVDDLLDLVIEKMRNPPLTRPGRRG